MKNSLFYTIIEILIRLLYYKNMSNKFDLRSNKLIGREYNDVYTKLYYVKKKTTLQLILFINSRAGGQ